MANLDDLIGRALRISEESRQLIDRSEMLLARSDRLVSDGLGLCREFLAAYRSLVDSTNSRPVRH